jgi:hypothetical protein
MLAVTRQTVFCCAFAGSVYGMTVEFRLLGDVEVRVDGRLLDIGPCAPAVCFGRVAGRCELCDFVGVVGGSCVVESAAAAGAEFPCRLFV